MSVGTVILPGRIRRVVEYEEIPESEVLLSMVWKALGLDEPPREGPCWCNGPYREERLHHEWCRENRKLWRKALRALRKLRRPPATNP